MNEKRQRKDVLEADALRVFSYLDDELSPEDRQAFESSLLEDSSLAARVVAYRSLFETLDGVGRLRPAKDFKARVLATVVAPEAPWIRLARWLLGGSARRPDPNPLAAVLDGDLSRRQARALAAFLSRDPESAAAMGEWRGLFKQLSRLPAFSPSVGFRDQVMARIRAQAPALAPVPARRRLLERLGAVWPGRRERLAAVSGVAFGPTAVVAATVYMTLSNPLVTPSNLLGYLWAKGTTVMGGLAETLSGGALETGALGSLLGFVNGLALTGAAIASVLLVFAGLTLMSGWILYKNVVKAPSMDRPYAAA